MKRYRKYIIITLVLLVCAITTIILLNINKNTNNENEKFKIVTSFYPMYIMTANITQGANNIELVNMADMNIGCIHDYTLNTEDMKKIETADIFIQNGLGLESFMENITANNPKIKIVNSSENITDIIQDEETNPHVWTSIENYINQVDTISNELIKYNPENGQIYRRNAEQYIQKLEELKEKYSTELIKLRMKKAICLNESLEYLGKQIEMKLTTIQTNHEESTMSAETLRNVIDIIKENNIKIIIVDINDDLKNAQTIANETGATIYQLDSALTGNLAKDSYLNSMNGNLEKLKEAIN